MQKVLGVKKCLRVCVKAGTYICLEGAGNRGENVEKYRIPGVSRRNEREDGHGRMTEHEGGQQKQKKQQQQKKKKTKKKNKNIMMMMMMRMMMMMTMTMTMTMMINDDGGDDDDDEAEE